MAVISNVETIAKLKQYHVYANTAPGKLVEVYAGSSEREAQKTCNFWDLRVNTFFVDLFTEYAQLSPLEQTVFSFNLASAELLGEDVDELVKNKFVVEAYSALFPEVDELL